ncbi:pentapeptide repeat-containing protein [Sagittula salina]|uniref:Pentapeptide repeat-containing protein n=1 Tax=Sagittula salina TaxID=2820268 RepID=A0A940MGN1_9RHOB|nr:pentapeptide repeat-containing protein [Sagittula salina]MBP0481360.1 pentapeptide repeat-containing protein [Sagittula salina]
MRLVEDYLDHEDLRAIKAVYESNTPRFDLLVKASGLDPKRDFQHTNLRNLDFCGADLRGFDFSGSDLRQSAKNSNTLIDDTTIFGNAKIDWIDRDSLPIVLKMQQIEAVTTPNNRRLLLNELTTEFGKTPHVVTYMISAATNASDLETFLDFSGFIPKDLSAHQFKTLRGKAQTLLKKRLSRARSRTGRERTAIFSIDSIANQLRNSPSSLSEHIYERLVKVVSEKQHTISLKGMATIEPNDLTEAFARIGY